MFSFLLSLCPLSPEVTVRIGFIIIVELLFFPHSKHRNTFTYNLRKLSSSSWQNVSPFSLLPSNHMHHNGLSLNFHFTPCITNTTTTTHQPRTFLYCMCLLTYFHSFLPFSLVAWVNLGSNCQFLWYVYIDVIPWKQNRLH